MKRGPRALASRLLIFVSPAQEMDWTYIQQISCSAGATSDLRTVMDDGLRRVRWWYSAVGVLYALAGLVAFAINFRRSEWLAGAGLVAAILATAAAVGFGNARKQRDYLVVRGCLAACRSAALAEPTAPASFERRVLASQILGTARIFRKYRLYVTGLDGRLIRRSAKDAEAALKSFTHAVLFGTQEDLQRIKESLARSALRVGPGHWTQVASLREEVPSGEPSFDLSFIQTTTRRLLLPVLLLVVGLLAKKFGVEIE